MKSCTFSVSEIESKNDRTVRFRVEVQQSVKSVTQHQPFVNFQVK